QLLVAAILWGAGYVRERRMPRLPIRCSILAMWLALVPWLSLLNPESSYDPQGDHFAPMAYVFRWLPTTVDTTNTLPYAVCVSACLLVLPIAADLSGYLLWQRRFLMTIAIVGVSIVAAGLVLKT